MVELDRSSGRKSGHDFHETKQGTRFTFSERARVEILDRLLALNHERYRQEVAEGLHEKKKMKSAAAKRKGVKAAAKAPAGGLLD